MFPGDNGVDSLNDIGCFGNYGGIEMSGGHDDWGAGGGGAGTKGKPTSESMGIQYAGDGGSGKNTILLVQRFIMLLVVEVELDQQVVILQFCICWCRIRWRRCRWRHE